MSKQFYFKQFSLAWVRSLDVKTVLFQKSVFSISTQFSSIWPMGKTLSGATTPGQSGLGNNGNEGVLRIPSSSRITGTSPSVYLVPYPGHSFGEGVFSLSRGAIGVFCRLSRLGNLNFCGCTYIGIIYVYIYWKDNVYTCTHPIQNTLNVSLAEV